MSDFGWLVGSLENRGPGTALRTILRTSGGPREDFGWHLGPSGGPWGGIGGSLGHLGGTLGVPRGTLGRRRGHLGAQVGFWHAFGVVGAILPA